MENNTKYSSYRTNRGKVSINWMILTAVVALSAWAGTYIALHQTGTKNEKYIPTALDKALIQLLDSEALPQAGEAPTLADEFTPQEPLNGRIMLSGRERGTVNSMHMISLDVATSSDFQAFPTYLTVSALAEFKDVTDPQSGYFVSAVSQYPLVYEDGFGIHDINTTDKTFKYLKSASSTGERYLDWSPTAKLLAFSRTTDKHIEKVDNIQIQNWETVVLDPEKEEIVKTIADATQPQWSPDGTTLIYLKEDGLYATTLADGEEVKIVGIDTDAGGKFLVNTMIEVSPDGTHLVWTIPGRGVVIMYEIESWAPFTLKELGRIEQGDTQFFWPAFSPDGNYYVVEAISEPAAPGAGRTNPRLEVRPTLGKNIIYTRSLSAFDFNNLFIDSWIAGN